MRAATAGIENFTVLGFNWDWNKNWSVMAEAGFGGTRKKFSLAQRTGSDERAAGAVFT
jgi:hypothetical protein